MISRRPQLPRYTALLLVAVLVSACGSAVAPSQVGGIPTATAATATPGMPSPTPSPTASPTPPASCAARTLASLTEAQRIGQLFVLGLAKDQLDDAERDAIARYHVGSMTFTTQTGVGVRGIRAVTDAVQ